MNKLILYFTLLYLIAPKLYGQIDSDFSLDRTKTESLFFIQKTKSFISNYYSLKENELDWLTIDLEIYETDYEKLNKAFSVFLSKLDQKEQKAIKQKIDIWYKNSILINFPYDLEETELLESLEIISELEQTKKYVDQFIVIDGQYWGSLASGQATEVYYEMMEHLFNMSDKEKLRFFKDYYELAYEKGK